MDTGRRASASIGVRSGRRRADKAAGSPANRADGTVAPVSGPDIAPAPPTPLDLTDAAPADTSNTRLNCPISATHSTPRHCAASRRLVFVEVNAPGPPILDIFVQPGVAIVLRNSGQDGVPRIAADPTNHDIGNLAAIDIVAHGAVQLGTAAPSPAAISAATPAEHQTQARPTATAH